MVESELKSNTEKKTAVRASVTTPPLLSRYEAKYTIPFSQIDSIVQFISPYCSYDTYSTLSPDKFYIVNSLYFDTPDLHFLRQRMTKAEKRFNMRIRSYGNDPSFPYFFEIKQRVGDVVRKVRAKVDDPDFAAPFKASSCQKSSGDESKNTAYRNLFYRTANQFNAHPVVLVQYRRQAFFSNYDEYARVTFDIDLRYMQQSDYDPRPVLEEMSPCDAETCFSEGTSVILELKCYTSYVPLWMIDLVRSFQLKRTGFSKYSTCLKPVLSRHLLDERITRNPVMCNQFFTEVI